MQNLKNLLEQATTQLAASSKTPRLDAELLLGYILQKDRVYLFSHPEYDLSFQEHQQWRHLLSQRCLQIPVAYLIGQKYFWNLDLQVNQHTLIPRPETELLVELVLCRGDRLVAQGDAVNVLDLGTGSGAIALALAHERPNWKISAVDFSEDALKIAKINAAKNNIFNVEFFHSDWFSTFVNDEKWDVIVSNPPYLDENDAHLITEEIRHEPREALVSKKNGLADFEKIIADARYYFKPGGQIFLEHGCAQGEAVRELFLLHGYGSVETSRDLAGLERVTWGVVSEVLAR
ncbi:MAG: peptide chain release factor N(5)-glutamine methyltransferase [Gammaproteobacteria bacterium]|nr:peptide chain release factor N(5)-glutamine methyltransferase [Gammaproteobacteria bacterium]